MPYDWTLAPFLETGNIEQYDKWKIMSNYKSKEQTEQMILRWNSFQVVS